MRIMKIGVKTFNNSKFLEHFEKDVDFFEVQAIQKNNYSFLKNFSLPIVVHAEHNGFGVDISNKKKENKNLKAINFAKKVADLVDSKKIIIHPGASKKLGGDCCVENTIDFLRKIDDKRILIENVVTGIGNSPETIKEIMEKTGVGFCFDVNHAICYAKLNKMNENKVIKEFLRLNPKHFHVGGQRFVSGKHISHISLKDFDYNWRSILSLYPKDAEITLETTIDIKKVEKDVEFIKELVSEID